MKLLHLIISQFRYFHCSKPEFLYHHNGNYDWTFQKIGPFYMLSTVIYDDSNEEIDEKEETP